MQPCSTPTKLDSVSKVKIQLFPPDSPCETVLSASSVDSTSRRIIEDKNIEIRGRKEEQEEMNNVLHVIGHDVSYGIFYRFWSFFLGCTGLLDMTACLLPPFLKSFSSQDDEGDAFGGAAEVFPNALVEWVRVLDRHGVSISFLFSVVWFVDAFLEAQSRRKRILLQQEKDFFLSKGHVEPRKWWQTASFVYYRIIAIQLLLLPVGFYMQLFYALSNIWNGEAIEDLDQVNESITLTVTNEDYEVQYETFTTKSKRSLMFAIFHHFLLMLSGHTVRAVRRQIRVAIPSAIRSLVRRAIRNPFKLKRTIGKLLTILRWIKYLAPLIGALNKLKGNIEDMIKKFRQRRIAQKQKRVRQLLWERKAVEMQEEDAARMIQSAFRAYQARKAKNALLAFRGDQRYLAALKLQRAFLKALQRAQRRLRARQEEYRRLAKMRRKNNKKLSDEEKKQFYELQDEFAKDANELINRKLLLRPNTRFSVYWKFLFVFCVTIEITQLMAKPWLDSYKSRRRDDPMTMSEFIAISFVPTRVSHLPECGYNPEPKGFRIRNFLSRPNRVVRNDNDTDAMPFYCHEPLSIVQETYSDIISLILVPAPVEQWPDCQHQRPSKRPKKVQPANQRWFCLEPYKSFHGVFRKVVDFLLEEFLVLVSIVCFLDVFVTFFTGEFEDTTGSLIPKPFFARWILPGLLLQLAVNPNVETFADFVFSLWDEVVRMGPVRVYRWTEAVIYPVGYHLWIRFITYVWIPLVHYENELEKIVNRLV